MATTQIEDFARHYMWKRLSLHGWDVGKLRSSGNCHEWKPISDDYIAAENRAYQHGSTMISEEEDLRMMKCPPVMNSLDNCVPTPIVKESYYQRQEEKESAMYGAQAVTLNIPSQETYDPLKYILYRLESIRDTKMDTLREDFNVDGMRPKTIKELKQWLKDGYYYIDTPKGWDEDAPCWTLEFFNWGEKPDMDGFNAAREKLNEAYYSVVDLVKIKTDEDTRLKALQDFQAATFH